MIITGRTIGLAIGILAGVSSLFEIISILLFNADYSYVAIGLEIFSCIILLSLCRKK